MSYRLNENDMKQHENTVSLPLYADDDPNADRYLCRANSCTFAEATDSFQLIELLNRKYYRPVAAIRYRDESSDFVRVYFFCIHHSKLAEQQEPIDRIEVSL